MCSFCAPISRILFRLVFSSPHKITKLKYDNIASQFSVTFSSTYQPQKGFGSLRQLIATPPQLAVILLQNNCGNTLAGTHSHLMPKGKQSLPPMLKPPSEATQRYYAYRKLIPPHYITKPKFNNTLWQRFCVKRSPHPSLCAFLVYGYASMPVCSNVPHLKIPL